jgi:hypothetical protein
MEGYLLGGAGRIMYFSVLTYVDAWLKSGVTILIVLLHQDFGAVTLPSVNVLAKLAGNPCRVLTAKAHQ